MIASNVSGHVEEFVVEQPASVGSCIVLHAPDEHVISVSQDTLGSEPYSHVSSPLQVAPACGFDIGQDEVLSADEELHPTIGDVAPPTIQATPIIAILLSQAVMAAE